MALVQIDVIRAQAFERCIQLFADLRARQPAVGRDIGKNNFVASTYASRGTPASASPRNVSAAPATIDVGGIEQIDPDGRAPGRTHAAACERSTPAPYVSHEPSETSETRRVLLPSCRNFMSMNLQARRSYTHARRAAVHSRSAISNASRDASRPVRFLHFHHDSMDKLGLMEIFVRIVETGSFSAVAREMAMSQPTVSKQIGALERSLKTRLLNRTTRSLSLTEAGAAYYERCRKIIDQVQAAETSLGAFQGKLTGTLSINSSVAFGQMFLTQLVLEFRRHMRIFPWCSR
jgi:molybdenum-dependent DNA-binding transcriptional regulator ModE